MATEIWVNIGSGNGLLPEGRHQVITWTNVDWSSVNSCDIHIRAISQEIIRCLNHQSLKSLWKLHINGLVQDCSISIANALEILQSCTKPSISKISFKFPRGQWSYSDMTTVVGYQENTSTNGHQAVCPINFVIMISILEKKCDFSCPFYVVFMELFCALWEV